MDGFERFWDTNRDGELDFVERATRDEFYMKELFGEEGSSGDDDSDDYDSDDFDSDDE